MFDEMLKRHARKQEVGCVDGLDVARSLVDNALRYINFYTRGDARTSSALLAIIVCDAVNQAHRVGNRFENYELPLGPDGRKLDLKSMLLRLEVHAENMAPKVRTLADRAARVGLHGRMPFNAKKPDRS